MAPRRSDCSRLFPRAWPNRKPAANRSPAPVVSTSFSIGSAANVGPLLAARGERAVLAARHDEDLHLVFTAATAVSRCAMPASASISAWLRKGCRCVPCRSSLNPSVAVDAEGVGQGESDLATGLASDLDRADHRIAGRFRVPEIAFEVEDRAVADLRLVQRARGQMLRGAEEGVHGPVPVGRHQDHRARGGRAHVRRRRDELDACGRQVMPVEFAELIRSDLPDEARAPAERRHARRRIAGRSAAHLMRRPHVRIEPLRLLRIDQAHRSFDQPFGAQEVVGRIGDDVDDGCRCTARRGGCRA